MLAIRIKNARYRTDLGVRRAANEAKRRYWNAYRGVTEARYSPTLRDRLEATRREVKGLKSKRVHMAVADKFKAEFADQHYHTCGYSLWLTVSANVEHGDEAGEMLKWWREQGYRSKKFTDYPREQHRTYELNARDSESRYGSDIEFKVYFTGEACKFVETGETNHVEAVEAYDRPVLELQCEGAAIPTE